MIEKNACPAAAPTPAREELPATADVVVIGAGLVGLATAYRYLERRKNDAVLLLEKDDRVACQQSTHNSGVLHAGLSYRPGSEKARLCVRGLSQMVQFCRHHGLPHEICGKVVVATRQEELDRLDGLLERGLKNGLGGLRRLGAEELREIEPHAAGLGAIQVPQEGIVDYRAVADRLAAEIAIRGGKIVLSAQVRGSRREGDRLRLLTTQGEIAARLVINCGGLHSDRITQALGDERPARIVPFRGEYYQLKHGRRHLVRHLIYPVPDPTFPFLGVHFTRMIHGGIEAGPNAVLALAREGYKKTHVRLADVWDAVGFAGLWRFVLRHRGMVAQELYRSFVKRAFCAALQRLVPEIQAEDLEPGGAGVRAQAMRPDGSLVEDFLFVRRHNVFSVVNAPSPAATASLAIGERIVDEALIAMT